MNPGPLGDGKRIRVSGLTAVEAKYQTLPDGVVGEQMKNGPQPGPDLLSGDPEPVLELLNRKGGGAFALWKEFKAEVAKNGGSSDSGWRGPVPSGVEFGDEWKVTGVVTTFASRFAEHGLEVFFCSTEWAMPRSILLWRRPALSLSLSLSLLSHSLCVCVTTLFFIGVCVCLCLFPSVVLVCSDSATVGHLNESLSAKERFYWLELKDVSVAPGYSPDPRLVVPGRMAVVLKKESPDTKLGLTLVGVGSALICADLAVDSACYQAGLRDGDCILTINGEACHEKIYKPINAHPGRDAAIARLKAAEGDVNLWVHKGLCPDVRQIMQDSAAANKRRAEIEAGCCLVM
jgi:hypothetical protein